MVTMVRPCLYHGILGSQKYHIASFSPERTKRKFRRAHTVQRTHIAKLHILSTFPQQQLQATAMTGRVATSQKMTHSDFTTYGYGGTTNNDRCEVITYV